MKMGQLRGENLLSGYGSHPAIFQENILQPKIVSNNVSNWD